MTRRKRRPFPPPKRLRWVKVCTPCIQALHENCGGDCDCANPNCVSRRAQMDGEIDSQGQPITE